MDKKSDANVWIYARVSTDKQDTANQLQGCREKAATCGCGKPREVLEEASTKKQWRERAIAGVLAEMPAGSTLIVSEISRLARSTLECLEIFREAAQNGITIISVKNGITLDGSIQGRIVSTVLAMAAEIERDMIRARTREALERRKAQGLPLGRPVGAKSESKIAKRKNEIDALTRAKVSDSAIARLLGVSRGTLARFRASQEEVEA